MKYVTHKTVKCCICILTCLCITMEKGPDTSRYIIAGYVRISMLTCLFWYNYIMNFFSGETDVTSPFEDPSWSAPFADIIGKNGHLLELFQHDYYKTHRFQRVKSEDPPDWERYVNILESSAMSIFITRV